MEQILRAIYRLQQIDLELDDLEAGSGDLPADIDRLESELIQTQSEIAHFTQTVSDLRKDRNEGNLELQELRGRAVELNEKLRNVRNNKEYDATSSEIESADQRVLDITSNLSGLDHREAEALKELQLLEKRRDELQELISDKKETLESIHSSNTDEIAEFRAMKIEALRDIPKDILERYLHVRAKHADAVVKTRKGACSGCYRAITPQTLVEMRRNQELFICEHCNRLLIDEELAETVSIQEAE